jgi:hypothetical protein
VSDRDIDAAHAGMNRRALVTKLAVGAFAVPAIVAFKLDSLARAGGFSKHPQRDRHSDPDCHIANGTQPNGTLPDSGTIPDGTDSGPPQGGDGGDGGDGHKKKKHRDSDDDGPKKKKRKGGGD